MAPAAAAPVFPISDSALSSGHGPYWKVAQKKLRTNTVYFYNFEFAPGAIKINALNRSHNQFRSVLYTIF